MLHCSDYGGFRVGENINGFCGLPSELNDIAPPDHRPSPGTLRKAKHRGARPHKAIGNLWFQDALANLHGLVKIGLPETSNVFLRLHKLDLPKPALLIYDACRRKSQSSLRQYTRQVGEEGEIVSSAANSKQFGVLEPPEIPPSDSMHDVDIAEAAIEKRLTSYSNSELRKEADIYCKNLAILALHWDQEINEVELAHPNLQTRPPDYGDAVRVKHKDEYAMRRWPEAQALRVSLASRLPAKQIDKVNQEVPRGPDLFDSRYLEQPADLRTIQEYLEALARYI